MTAYPPAYFDNGEEPLIKSLFSQFQRQWITTINLLHSSLVASHCLLGPWITLWAHCYNQGTHMLQSRYGIFVNARKLFSLCRKRKRIK